MFRFLTPSKLAGKIFVPATVYTARACKSDDAADSASSAADGEKSNQHVQPKVVLEGLLGVLAEAQHNFLIGSDTANGLKSKSTGNFFASINECYDARMERKRTAAAKTYGEERRRHYTQRLEEETEEFRRERKEIHDALLRDEKDKYKVDFRNDIKDFTAARQKECEERLQGDVEKYHTALRTYRSRTNGRRAKNYDGLEKNLTAQVDSIVKSLEESDDLYDFGLDAQGDGNDLTDADIRRYVEQRVLFYESNLQDEIDFFTKKRRIFYEDLIKSRTIRHAAKIRADTNEFKKARKEYYEKCVNLDVNWMTISLEEHYERCFLQCYARQAWLHFRNEQSQSDKPLLEDLSGISIAELQQKLPLSSIIDTYMKEALKEESREIFADISRALAAEGLTPPPGEEVANPDQEEKEFTESEEGQEYETEEYEEYEEEEE